LTRRKVHNRNSDGTLGITIPKYVAKEHGIEAGDEVTVTIDAVHKQDGDT